MPPRPSLRALIFIAWVLNDTKTIKLGTGTVNLPNHHPAMVAAEVAMLDHMAEGRFLFGISPGGLSPTPSCSAISTRTARRCSSRRSTTSSPSGPGEPPYDLKGDYWTISIAQQTIKDIGQGYIHKPYQRPHPPIMVTAVAPFSKGVTEAAARGWEPISANFLLPIWVKSHWPRYVEGCEKGGRKADPANWRIAKSIFVAEDLATAKRYATEPGGPYYHYHNSLVTKLVKNGRANLFKADQKAPDSSVTTEGAVGDLVIWGTPDKVADDLLAFRETVGDFGTLLYAGFDWVDKGLGIRSMELMAEKVMPAVNRAIGEKSQAA